MRKRNREKRNKDRMIEREIYKKGFFNSLATILCIYIQNFALISSPIFRAHIFVVFLINERK